MTIRVRQTLQNAEYHDACRLLKEQLLQYTNKSAHTTTRAQKLCMESRSSTVPVSVTTMQHGNQAPHFCNITVHAQHIADRAGTLHVVWGWCQLVLRQWIRQTEFRKASHMSWCTRTAPAKRAQPPTKQAAMNRVGNLVLLRSTQCISAAMSKTLE